jgi:hypothetical protein
MLLRTAPDVAAAAVAAAAEAPARASSSRLLKRVLLAPAAAPAVNASSSNSSSNATVALNMTVTPGSNGTSGGTQLEVRLTGVNGTTPNPALNAYLGSMFKAPLPAVDEEVKQELEDRPPLNITILVDMDVADIPKLSAHGHAHAR